MQQIPEPRDLRLYSIKGQDREIFLLDIFPLKYHLLLLFICSLCLTIYSISLKGNDFFLQGRADMYTAWMGLGRGTDNLIGYIFQLPPPMQIFITNHAYAVQYFIVVWLVQYLPKRADLPVSYRRYKIYVCLCSCLWLVQPSRRNLDGQNLNMRI